MVLVFQNIRSYFLKINPIYPANNIQNMHKFSQSTINSTIKTQFSYETQNLETVDQEKGGLVIKHKILK